ncbi:MAG: hypothetical protein LBH60_01045 [Prevotellaceae bacterium]|jgi:hypothetical protein|nr:hypothetical protein [Prevotellaceae bacterium]
MRAGLYSYSVRKIDGSFEKHKMPVEIIDEHPATYLVRFLHVHADGRAYGTKSWVRKRSVYLADGARLLQAKKNYKNYLPYKD